MSLKTRARAWFYLTIALGCAFLAGVMPMPVVRFTAVIVAVCCGVIVGVLIERRDKARNANEDWKE